MKNIAYIFSVVVFFVYSLQVVGCNTTSTVVSDFPVSDDSEAISVTTKSDEKSIIASSEVHKEELKIAEKKIEKKSDTAKTIKSIRISTLEQLINEIDKENNNIVIECPIDLDENILYIASGVVITGDDSAVLYNGTVRGDSVENVKLKSITFWGCPVTFFNDCKSVNISYCTFSGDENGTQSMLYILKGLGIEIAYCEFIGEDEVQTPLVLIGDRSNIASECQVQIHHCSFLGNASFQSKAAMIHLYNSSFNYLEDDKARFMLAPGTASQYMIENCSFYCDENPILCYFDVSATSYAGTFSRIYQNKCTPEIRDENCVYDSSDALKSFKQHLSSKKLWQIPYHYVLEDIENIKIGHS
mgnify:CR=1 FL=1